MIVSISFHSQIASHPEYEESIRQWMGKEGQRKEENEEVTMIWQMWYEQIGEKMPVLLETMDELELAIKIVIEKEFEESSGIF